MLQITWIDRHSTLVTNSVKESNSWREISNKLQTLLARSDKGEVYASQNTERSHLYTD